MGSQGVGKHIVRAINLRQIEVRGNGIDLFPRNGLARVRIDDASVWIEDGPREGLVTHLTGIVGVGENLEQFSRVARSQVHVVVKELSERVAEIGQAVSVQGLEILGRNIRIGLAIEDIADNASAGVIGKRGSAETIGILGGASTAFTYSSKVICFSCISAAASSPTYLKCHGSYWYPVTSSLPSG